MAQPRQCHQAYPGSSLFVFAENTGLTGANGLNAAYTNLTVGGTAMSDNLRAHTLKQQVFCFGFVMGQVEAMAQLVERLAIAMLLRGFPDKANDSKHAECAQKLSSTIRPCPAIDQGAYNVLIHSGALDDLGLQRVPNEEPWVAHLTSQLTPKEAKIPHAELMATRAVVHQYKYCWNAKKYIWNRFGEKFGIGYLDTSRIGCKYNKCSETNKPETERPWYTVVID
jgi:hypothetical protein